MNEWLFSAAKFDRAVEESRNNIIIKPDHNPNSLADVINIIKDDPKFDSILESENAQAIEKIIDDKVLYFNEGIGQTFSKIWLF